ncbi:MAG: VOC family protein, partial [Steroidobacteraceae bacterium]
ATSPPSSPKSSSVKGPSGTAVGYVVVSVADLDAALDFWVNRLGMEIETRRTGEDAQLAAAWGLPHDGIVDQALLHTPGMFDGGVHLVQFRTPGPPVRRDAANIDLLPSAMEVAVRDLPARYAELLAAGFKFGSTIQRTTASDGRTMREAHLLAAEDMDLILVEPGGAPEPVSPQGFGATPRIVLTTSDIAREREFFRYVFRLEPLATYRLGGAAASTLVSTGRDVTVLGNGLSRYGQLELVRYDQGPGRNLYARARPPARGMLSITFVVPDLTPILERGRSFGLRELGRVRSILGEGRMAQITSPAGLRIDVVEL